MDGKNEPDVSLLETGTTADIAALSAETLCMMQDEVKALSDRAALLKKRLTAAVLKKYGDAESAKRVSERKETGIVRWADGSVTVECDRAKSVKWNFDLLSAALGSLNKQDVEFYGKWTLSVDEDRYKIAPKHIKDKLEPCRTLTAGAASFKLVKSAPQKE